MDQNQRPHSRQKFTGSGSAHVGKGNQVNTGSRPVGAGGRGTPSGGRSVPGGTQRANAPVLRLKPKTLLILIVLAVIALIAFKACGGGMADVGEYSSLEPSTSFTEPSTPAQPASNQSEVNTEVSSLARAKRVTPVGGGKDIVTVMVYMCGTDLESKHGMATNDLQEMLNATISDKVNVIIETGGCKQWKVNGISNQVNQIYKMEDDGMKQLKSDFGTAAMTDPQNLTDFINYCERNYPADRNMLIFWDHGGGSLSGYGYDEKNPKASSMTLSKINTALSDANCVFDWIGFDACLMATLETGLVCNEYADYLLASEETEPGTGWDYTGWLTELSKNTSMPTLNIAENIIDGFVSASCKASRNAQVTLSVVDLAELQGAVPDAFRDFAASTNELLQTDNYQQVSNARAGVRQFAQSSKINQVDLVDLALRIGTKESKALADALQGCVKYNKSTISRCYGISIFFPYETTSNVKNAVSSYKDLGMDSEYAKCIQSFASLEYGGQIAAASSQQPGLSVSGGDMLGSLLSAYAGSGSSTSPLDALMGSFLGGGQSPAAGVSLDPATVLSLLGSFSGRSMPADYDWVDTQLIADNAEAISKNYIDPARITASTVDGKNVLQLTDEEWALIQTVELNVFSGDGEGYMDLGLDNTFDWYNDSLLLEYDGTWLTVNGNVCAYYLVSDTQQEDGSWVTVGRIPALLNGEFVNLQVVFTDDAPEGVITGAYPLYEDDVDVQAKGDITVNAGDEIQFLCDYYDLDGNYSASYELGEAFTVPESGLALRNLKIDAEDPDVTYRLTDIYGNHYWLPVED